jgi:hypothetical protein
VLANFTQPVTTLSIGAVVTRPRQVLPGNFYLVTRRCSQRQFLLSPDDEINNAIAYCLADSAKRFKIDVLLTTVESNHHHTAIYDRYGRFPRFIDTFKDGREVHQQGAVNTRTFGHRETVNQIRLRNHSRSSRGNSQSGQRHARERNAVAWVERLSPPHSSQVNSGEAALVLLSRRSCRPKS